jgi:hypothetical protein
MSLAIYAYEAEHAKETKSLHNGNFNLTYDQSQNKIIYAPEQLTSNQFYNKTEVDTLIAGEGAHVHAASGINITTAEGSITIGTKVDNETLDYNSNGALKVINPVPQILANAGINIESRPGAIAIGTKVDNTTIQYDAQGALTAVGGSGDNLFTIVEGIEYPNYLIEQGTVSQNVYFISFNEVPKSNKQMKVFRYMFLLDMFDESGYKISAVYSSETESGNYENPMLSTVILEDGPAWYTGCPDRI